MVSGIGSIILHYLREATYTAMPIINYSDLIYTITAIVPY